MTSMPMTSLFPSTRNAALALSALLPTLAFPAAPAVATDLCFACTGTSFLHATRTQEEDTWADAAVAFCFDPDSRQLNLLTGSAGGDRFRFVKESLETPTQQAPGTGCHR
jgi:hypothetical protein